MFLWSARAAFPSEFAGFRLTLWDLTLPPQLSSWVLCPFPSPPPLQLPPVSSDGASLQEEKQDPLVRNTQSFVMGNAEHGQNLCFSWACPPCPASRGAANKCRHQPAQGPAATHIQASTPLQQLLEPCPQESQHLLASSAWFRGVPAACPLEQDATGHHHSWPQGLISKGNNGHERGTKVPASATTFCQGAPGDPQRAWAPLDPKILSPSGPDTLKNQLSL